MICSITGKCLFAGDPRQTKPGRDGSPPRTFRQFQVLVEHPKQQPELVKVISFNGFNPKLGESVTFNARVRANVFNNRGYINVEVI